MEISKNLSHYLNGCTAMEFEQMQKLWDEEKKENYFVINEEAMHQSVGAKKNAANRRINLVEITISIINLACAVFLFNDALDDPHYWDYVGSAMMVGTVIYIQYSRRKRIKAEKTFDRSVLGELDHAISNTNAIITFSRLMAYGYFVPISIFYTSKMIFVGASLEKWFLVSGMFIFSFILIYWERKKMHIPRRQKLEALKEKLMN